MTSAREAFMPSVLPENMGATTGHIVAIERILQQAFA